MKSSPPKSPAAFIPKAFDASGAFETCRVMEGKVLDLGDHLGRLKASLQSVGFPRWDERPVRQALARAGLEVQEGWVRISFSRNGDPPWRIYPRRGMPYYREMLQRGISVRTVASRWPPGDGIQAQVKASERLSGVLARLEHLDSVEVLRLGAHGYLTEGTASNLFIVKERRLLTPPLWLGVLQGVMRGKVLQAAERLRIQTQEVPITRHELFNAEEAFLTNVLMGILPVRRADGRRIGDGQPGPITRRLIRAVER